MYSRATRARATPQQPVVLGRPVDTGHKLAPGYVPLSSNEMSDLVASMAEVYRAAAAQTISKAKEDHRCGPGSRQNSREVGNRKTRTLSHRMSLLRSDFCLQARQLVVPAATALGSSHPLPGP